MREVGQLGVMAKKHHALELVAELVNDVKQVISPKAARSFRGISLKISAATKRDLR